MEQENKVKAILIIEVLGKPAKHIDEAIQDLIDRLGKEKDVAVVNKKFHEPKQTEKLFITFCEVEIAVPSLFQLLQICFLYMPSSVEIVEPLDLHLNLNDANLFFNVLVSRLHQYDGIAKHITFENMILKNQIQQLKSSIQQRAQQPAMPMPQIQIGAKKQKSTAKTKTKKKK